MKRDSIPKQKLMLTVVVSPEDLSELQRLVSEDSYTYEKSYKHSSLNLALSDVRASRLFVNSIGRPTNNIP